MGGVQRQRAFRRADHIQRPLHDVQRNVGDFIHVVEQLVGGEEIVMDVIMKQNTAGGDRFKAGASFSHDGRTVRVRLRC